jgi:hypothetical protein
MWKNNYVNKTIAYRIYISLKLWELLGDLTNKYQDNM